MNKTNWLDEGFNYFAADPAPSTHGMMTTEKVFPMQGQHAEWYRGDKSDKMEITGVIPKRPAGQIPWRLAEIAYRAYRRRYGNDQTIERMAQRGGFGWAEWAALFAEELAYEAEKRRKEKS